MTKRCAEFEIDVVVCAVVGFAESLRDPGDHCACGVAPPIAVNNHWCEADAIPMASGGSVAECPFERLVFCPVLGGRCQWTRVFWKLGERREVPGRILSVRDPSIRDPNAFTCDTVGNCVTQTGREHVP